MNRIDPQVIQSFRQNGPDYIAYTDNYFTSNPAYKIASIAQNRVVEEAGLTLPEGYDDSTLERITMIAGFPQQEFRVSGRQAQELAAIGSQILELNKAGSIEPPLNYYEEQSVTHLVQLVGQTAIR